MKNKKEKDNIEPKEIIEAKISIKDTGIVLKLDNNFINQFYIRNAVLIAYGLEIEHYMPITKLENNDLYIELSKLNEIYDLDNSYRFKMALEIYVDNQYILYYVKEYSEDKSINLKSKKAYRNEIITPESDDKNQIAFTINKMGTLQVLIGKKTQFYKNKYVFAAKKLFIKKGVLNLNIAGDIDDAVYVKTVLRFRSKIESEAVEYEFTNEKYIDSKKTITNLQLNISDKTLKVGYWDIKIVLDIDGEEYIAPVESYIIKKHIIKLFYNQEYFCNNMIFYPYATLSGTIAFSYRAREKYDGFSFRIKERIAMALYILRKNSLKKKNIYLVYEKFCQLAQDNGYYFFKYCMENNVEEKLGGKIYYIIDKNSNDRKALEKYEDNLIDFMSLKHIVYVLSAKLLISTDTKDHAYAFRYKVSRLIWRIREKKLVFLQHGVTAFKQVDFLYGKGKYGGCDLFITTSDFEKNIVKEYFSYEDNEIANVGFCRWDVLEDKSKDSKEILMMPTWRNWLDNVTSEEFVDSDFFKNYSKFIKSEQLIKVLEENDLYLNYYMHPKFASYLGKFKIKSDRIKFISLGEEPLNEIMMRSKMLITDYSSVSWDMFYQDKPVVFYQFDLDNYNEAHGSYVNMETDLFGDRTTDYKDVFKYIDYYAKHNFKVKEKYEVKRSYLYKYVDNNNCKRLVEKIRIMDMNGDLDDTKN